MSTSSQTPDSFGDPTAWDEIPDAWTEAFTAAIEARGYTVTDAHETAITIDVPNLPEGHEWFIGKPNFHGLWAYGESDERGVCENPNWIYADATDVQDVADTVHAILSGAPTKQFWHGGTFAVYAAPAGSDTPTNDGEAR